MTPLRKPGFAFLALALAFSASACDPCTGISACVGGPRLSVEGSLVDDESGKPLVGARVDAIWVGGVRLEPDSVGVVTNESGYFRVTAGADAEGETAVDVGITPPAGHRHPRFRLRDLRFTTTSIRGDGHVLGLWTTDPRFTYVGETYYRSNAATPVANARVEFRRTAGVEVRGVGWSGDTYTTMTDADGRFGLFHPEARPVDAGEVVGDVTIYPPTQFGPTVLRGLRLRPTPAFRPPARPFRMGVGPHLPYYGVVLVGNAPAPGVEVEARRVGGIAVEPTSLTERTLDDGVFHLHRFVPRELGDLVIDLVFRPPAPWRSFEVRGLTLATVEEDSFGESVGVWDLEVFARSSSP